MKNPVALYLSLIFGGIFFGYGIRNYVAIEGPGIRYFAFAQSELKQIVLKEWKGKDVILNRPLGLSWYQDSNANVYTARSEKFTYFGTSIGFLWVLSLEASEGDDRVVRYNISYQTTGL